jgi:hypothetical protein
MTIFISHTSKDLPIAKMVESTLIKAGYTCWLDKSQIPQGTEFVTKIGEGLQQARVFILIDSAVSRQKYWVRREKEAARRLRKAGQLLKIVRAAVDDLPPETDFEIDQTITLDAENFESLDHFFALLKQWLSMPHSGIDPYRPEYLADYDTLNRLNGSELLTPLILLMNGCKQMFLAYGYMVNQE